MVLSVCCSLFSVVYLYLLTGSYKNLRSRWYYYSFFIGKGTEAQIGWNTLLKVSWQNEHPSSGEKLHVCIDCHSMYHSLDKKPYATGALNAEFIYVIIRLCSCFYFSPLQSILQTAEWYFL